MYGDHIRKRNKQCLLSFQRGQLRLKSNNTDGHEFRYRIKLDVGSVN